MCIRDSPSIEDIRLLGGIYSPEIVVGVFPSLQCFRTPTRQWLRNGILTVNRPNPSLNPSDEGIYQCVGEVPGQPETDFTGESASDLYLLVQGI